MLSNIISFIFALNIFTTVLLGWTSIGWYDDLAQICLFFLEIFLLVTIPQKFKFTSSFYIVISLFSLVIFFNLISALIFRYDIYNSFTFFYESYKLFIYLLFVPLIFLDKKFIKSILKKIIYILIIYLSSNIIVMILQYIFGAQITRYLGLTSKDFTSFTDFNLVTGIAAGKNGGGIISFYSLILILLIEKLDYLKGYKRLKILKYISILGIIISNTKTIVLCFMIFIINYSNIKKRYKYTIIMFLLILISYTMYIFNVFQLNDKIKGYTVFYNKFYYFEKGITKLSIGKTEGRAESFLSAYLLTKQNFPIGTGLGTWGDLTASSNKPALELKFSSKLSDSHFSHLLVEQGIIMFLYLYIFYFITKKHDKLGSSFFITFILVEIAMMGPSGVSYPMLMSLDIALFLLLDKEKKDKINYHI